MTTQFRAWKPLAATQNVAVTNTNQNITLNFTAGTRCVRVVNVGTETVFINFNAAATTASGLPVPAGQTELFTVQNDITTIGVIAATGGANTLYSTVGEGL